MKERIYRAFNLPAEQLSLIDSLVPEERAQAATVDEQDALEEYEADFLIRFTYNSNAIEGSTLSLDDTELIFEGEFPTDTADKRLKDVFAAIGIREGVELAREMLEREEGLDEEAIKDIHQATALDCQPRTRGVYRVVPVHIRGSQTVPANPRLVRELMQDLLFAYCNSTMHPVAKAAAFHAMFENIHPFRDGNGRTGRIVLNYMLEQAGYPPIAIKASGKQAYYDALESWQVREEPAALLGIIRACIEEENQGRAQTLELTRQAVKERDKGD